MENGLIIPVVHTFLVGFVDHFAAVCFLLAYLLFAALATAVEFCKELLYYPFRKKFEAAITANTLAADAWASITFTWLKCKKLLF